MRLFAKFVLMKCQINVYMLNEHFSQEHADAQHGGKPSENNRKYDWEDDMVITSNVLEVIEHRKVSFPLQGQMGDGTDFHYDITEMFLFEIKNEDAPSNFIGCSESIMHSFEKEIKEDTIFLKLYINDYEPYANPIPGIYIASKEFPSALAVD